MTNHGSEMHDRLSELLDGALPPRERAAVEEHLAECADCRGALAALQALRVRARALPREIAPPRDLWPEIAGRLRPRVEEEPADGPPPEVIRIDMAPRRAQRAGPRWPLLAAAAVVLVVLSSGLTAHLLRSGSGTLAVRPAGEAAPVTAAPSVALAAFRPVEAEYLGTVEALEAALAEHRDRLAPETVAVVEENLRIIDRAIAEARAALQADPSDADLPLFLADAYQNKVELLQRALQLPAQT